MKSCMLNIWIKEDIRIERKKYVECDKKERRKCHFILFIEKGMIDSLLDSNITQDAIKL